MVQFFRDIILNVIREFSQNDSKIKHRHNILIEIPRDETLGDLYTNAAMVYAKTIGMTPKMLAEHICCALKKCEHVVAATIAGPGFINFKLRPNAWHKIISEILEKKDSYSFSNIMKGQEINVEFVSANPTGPLHTGHARNAVFGSVIVKLLDKIGYKTIKEFYINDQGNQINSFARSLYLRYREHLGANIKPSDFANDMYIGQYVVPLAVELAEIYGDSLLNKDESEWIDTLSAFAVDRMVADIKSDLKILGVEMDIYTSEKKICSLNMVDEALSILSAHGDIYEGIIPEPKGVVDEDWEERPQTLFRSTKYGDDIDRPIRKSDGSWTYFAGDIAYHLDKIRRGYTQMIALLGADHNGYVKRLKSAVYALSDGRANIDVQLYQLVNFLENGVQIKMSKRSGNFITLRDVVERVGKDITRFMMISRHHDVMIDFDFVKAVECSMENPIFYIQYAYARISSVFRNVKNTFPDLTMDEIKMCNKDSLNDETEINLIKALCFWPEQIVSSALALEPHRIPHHLYNIASLFHTLWNKGKVNSHLRFIDENNRLATSARLSLLESTRIIIEDGLKIIGVTPLEEMK